MTTKATSASTAKEEPTNSDRFYEAKHDLFFCNEVVKLAAFAASAHRTLTAYDNAMGHYPEARAKIEKLVEAPSDWREFTVGLDWALNFTAQRMEDAMERMESAFMAAKKAAGC